MISSSLSRLTGSSSPLSRKHGFSPSPLAQRLLSRSYSLSHSLTSKRAETARSGLFFAVALITFETVRKGGRAACLSVRTVTGGTAARGVLRGWRLSSAFRAGGRFRRRVGMHVHTPTIMVHTGGGGYAPHTPQGYSRVRRRRRLFRSAGGSRGGEVYMCIPSIIHTGCMHGGVVYDAREDIREG